MAVQDAIKALVETGTLRPELAASALEELMTGSATPAQVGAFLTAWRLRGETAPAIAACLDVMLRHAEPVPAPNTIDICGTGGDGIDTINVSTAAGFVVAACGVRVAKHGNRAASSRCGSADVLEALGARIDLDGQAIARIIDACNFCFLFAQRMHPAMRHVAGARREIGIRTAFNILGPLSNPTAPARQLVGVGARALGPLVAEALALRGVEAALVVHSEDGLDEISPAAPTLAWVVGDGAVAERVITPADFGILPSSLEAVAGGDAPTNAGHILAILDGAEGPRTDFTVINAAAALVVAGRAADFREGTALARDAIASGRAREVLDAYIQLSREAAGG